MRFLTISLCALFITTPAVTEDTTAPILNTEKIAVTILQQQQEIAALKAEIKYLKNLLETVASPKEAITSDCSASLYKLEAKTIQLLKSGYTERHPDIVNLNHKKSKLIEICTTTLPEENSSPIQPTCKATIAKLMAKREQLKGLGFKDRHPDIAKLSKRIRDLQIRCSKI